MVSHRLPRPCCVKTAPFYFYRSRLNFLFFVLQTDASFTRSLISAATEAETFAVWLSVPSVVQQTRCKLLEIKYESFSETHETCIYKTIQWNSHNHSNTLISSFWCVLIISMLLKSNDIVQAYSFEVWALDAAIGLTGSHFPGNSAADLVTLCLKSVSYPV